MSFSLKLSRQAAVLGAAVLTLAGCQQTGIDSAGLKAEDNVAAAQPNIILITLEDLSPRFGSFGDPVAHTPNIDAFADESIRFTRVFTTAGVCAPSRSALITGVHQQTLGTMHMRTVMFDRVDGGFSYLAVPPEPVKAFPELLRAEGYYTLNNVKTDYQFGEPFTVWDKVGGSVSWTDAPTDKPFFFMLNFNETHESRTWPPEGESSADYIANRRRLNGEMDEQKTWFTNPDDVVVPPYYPDTPEVRANLARHYDNVAYADMLIGEVLDELRAAGRFDDSIIMITTDHGDGLPRAKRTIYDSGIMVPLIVRFPDEREAGTVRDELVSFVDLAPTILSMAGAEPREWMQGRVFAGPDAQSAPDVIYAAADRLDEVPGRRKAVRSERFKYIRNYDLSRPRLPDIGYQNNNPIMQAWRDAFAAETLSDMQAQYFQLPTPPEELYDLETDPWETKNLAGDPEYADELADMRDALQQWLNRAPDLSERPELDMVLDMWPGGEQPVTAPPTACLTPNDNMRLSSVTAGASIGYIESGHWQLYRGPVSPATDMTVKAVRYGFKESTEVPINVADLEACDD